MVDLERFPAKWKPVRVKKRDQTRDTSMVRFNRIML
ncbi:hypothetical protein ACVIGA_002449 [Bradyrhizobium sp. USDA 3240]